MNICRLLAPVCLLVLNASAPAIASTVSAAIITAIATNSNAGNVVFVQVSQAAGKQPACANNLAWQFVLPLATAPGQQTLALLLSARATGTPVTLYGSGQCDVYAGVETLTEVIY